MKTKLRSVLGLALLLVLVQIVSVTPTAAQAINSNAGTVTLNATLAESLSVNVTSGNVVNFTLASNTAANAGSVPTVVTAVWVLKPGRTVVTVWAWVATTGAALTGTGGAPATIPASAVSIVTTAGLNAPVVANGALNATLSGAAGAPAFITAGGSGLQFASKAITGLNKASLIGASLAWNIDTTVVPQLPADTYTGTVNIQAQATP